MEALMTFEAGSESCSFNVLTRDKNERVIRLRKQSTLINEKKVVIVIVKDETDRINFFQSQDFIQENQYRDHMLSVALTSSLESLR